MLKRMRSRLAFNLVAAFIIILLLFSLLTSAIGYLQFSGALNERYADNGYRIGRLSRQMLKSDDMSAYLDEEYWATEEYQTTMRRLDAITQFMDAAFIYVIIPDEDYQNVTFLFETVNQNMDLTPYVPGYRRDTSSDEYARKYRLLMEGRSEMEAVFRAANETTTGAHVSSLIPVKNNKGEPVAILCVQQQMQALQSTRNNFLLNIALATLLTIILTALLFEWFLRKRVTKPVREIASETVRFSRENTLPETSLTASTPGQDEIKLLAMHVDKMEYAILNYMNNLQTLTSERERLAGELNVANAIQRSILPSNFPPFPERDEFDLYASMDPAKEVGGDFYDFFFIDDDHLALVMADVSGKGVPAALFMMIAKIVLKNRAQHGGTPGEILEDVNRTMSEGNQYNMFVTTWLGILEVSTGILTTASAGHEFPALCRADGSFELVKDRHGFVLGGMPGTKYQETTITLQPGDSLFVYTDGVAEAINGNEEAFGMDRLLEALNASPHAAPEELLHNMTAAISDYAGDVAQFDDITMLALQYHGQRSHLRTLRIEADTENLGEVTEWVEEMLVILDVPPKTRMQILLAVEEIFVNIARYAYAPGVGDAVIRIGYDMDTDTVRLTFLDAGTPYNPLEREDPNTKLSAKEREVGGLGIYLVKETMDNVEYLHNVTYNILTIEKKIER